MIIGFCGKKAAGKNTAVEILNFSFEVPTRIVNFSHPLFEMQQSLYRRIYDVYRRESLLDKDSSLYSLLSDGWLKKLDKDILVRLWKKEVSHRNNKSTIILCTDVKTDAEAEALVEMNGVLVNITKNGLTDANINDKIISYTVANDGTPQEFQVKMLELYNKILPSTMTQKPLHLR